MDNKDTLFLDFYIANQCNVSKRLECYKMAFGDDANNLSDSSIDTYAKRILAKAESKQYIAERKVSSSTASYQLMEQIKELDTMLVGLELKPLERVQILKERRLSISELSKLIEIVKPSAGIEDKYFISDLCFTIDMGALQDYSEDLEELFDIVQALARRGSFLAVDEGGRIKQMSFSTKSGDGSKEIKQAIEAGKYKVAVERLVHD